jgi:Zn-dependent peptidase ImmA (M78 family)/transcriptional regulator with XRE-family HTH domain
MAASMPINPEVLKWARRQSGRSIAEVAHALNRSDAEIEQWERGEGGPTFAQLEVLAYDVFKRPTALFFFPAPPLEHDGAIEFRTIPADEVEKFLPDTRFAMRQAVLYQLSLNELHDHKNPVDDALFKKLQLSTGVDVVSAGARIRKELGLSIEDQMLWRNERTAFDNWRERFEAKGVYIFKRPFKQQRISGFCMVDDEFSLIVVNNSHSFTRQIYTLFHELAHILAREPGMTVAGLGYIDRITDARAKKAEVWCNALAAETLMPEAMFRRLFRGDTSDGAVGSISESFSVSREVVLRRMLALGSVSQTYYEAKVSEWGNQRTGSKSSGGDWYRNQVAYLGRRFIHDVIANHIKGRSSELQVAEYLGVKPTQIEGIAHAAGLVGI